MLGACAFALIAYAGLFVYEWWRDRWFGVLVKRRVAELYAHNWIGLIHADDEALGALRSARQFRPEIIPRDFLGQAFAMLPVVLIGGGLFTGFIWLEARLSEDGPVPPWLETAARTFVSFVEDIGAFPGFLTQIKWALALIAVFALATGLVYVFKIIGRMISIPLAELIDRTVWRSVRNEVWGDDMGAEAVRSVSSHPPLFPLSYGPIPEPVASQISQISDAGASETLKRLRQQIGMLSFGNNLRDPFANAMSQLSWHELVHTTYFEVEPFIRMIALTLHRHGVAGLRREAWPAEVKAATRDVLERMQVEQPGEAGDRSRLDGARADAGQSSAGLSVKRKTLVSVGIAATAVLAGIVLTSLFVPIWAALLLWALAAVAVLLFAELKPVSLEGLTARPDPSAGFAPALERFEAMRANPEALIHPRCRANVLHHGRRMPVACILVHGISNCPYSMIDFAPQVHALRYNLLIARMPFNGHLDNGTDALRHVTAENLRAFADECVDIAAGMGEQVVVLGISAGGVVAGWMAQNREDVEHAILVAPSFGLSSFGTGLNTTLMRLMLALPHLSIWKDPVARSKAFSRPHSYERQSTRGMGEVIRLGLATSRQASATRAGATRISVVTNGADPAVDPQMIARLVRKWREHQAPVETFEFAEDLKLPHELIDPTERGAQPELVYPRLLALIRPHGTGPDIASQGAKPATGAPAKTASALVRARPEPAS